MVAEILSVASVEAAHQILRETLGCAELNLRENGETVEFFDPKREINLWAQGDDSDELGGLVARLETKWHYIP